MDARYKVNGDLYTRGWSTGPQGVTETDVRRTLGDPTRIVTKKGNRGETLAHGLVYAEKGITFWVADDPSVVGNPPTSYIQSNVIMSTGSGRGEVLLRPNEVIEIEVYSAPTP